METATASRGTIITLEDIDRLQGIPINIHTWLRNLCLNGELELIARALIRAGTITAPHDAIHFLSEKVADPIVRRTTESVITFGDLQRLRYRHLRTFLREYLGERTAGDEPSDLALYHALGREGHSFAQWLYEDDVVIGESTRNEMRGRLPLFDRSSSQRYLGLRIGDEPHRRSPRLKPERNSRIIPAGDVRKLGRSMGVFKEHLVTLDAYHAKRHELMKAVTNLREVMQGHFPKHYSRLMQYESRNGLGWALSLMSLAGWGNLLLRRIRDEQSVASLTEIPVLPRDFEVWAGRIDRIDVSDGDSEVFAGLHREEFSSALDLVNRALALHKAAKFRVVDYKFAVGDNHASLIMPDMLPLKPHVEQLKWYLLWLAFGHSIMNGGDGKNLRADLFSGLLVYIMPNGSIVDVPVNPSPDDLLNHFKREVSGRWHSIVGSQVRRTLSMRALAAIRPLLSGIPSEPKTRASREGTVGQGSLFAGLHEKPRPVASLVHELRTFLDKTNIVEVVAGSGDEPKYRMHIDQLARNIGLGNVITKPNFSWERGGFVNCFMPPKHDEGGPSLNINFARGTFKCFSCMRGGAFARESVPADLAAVIPPEHIGFRRARSAGAFFEVPERMQKLLGDAQYILRENFNGSAAEHYLRNTRHLTDKMIEWAEPGCPVRDGRDVLISSLLAFGYTFDELVESGLLGFSEKAYSTNAAVKAFERHGLTLDDVSRWRKLRDSNRVRECPFSIFGGRVTFPLTLPIGGGKVAVTGFYGRSWDPDARMKHVCTTTGEVPRGMFNGREIAAWIAEGGVEKMTLTEAVVDATVVNTLGYGPVISFVGMGNGHLEAFLAKIDPGEINIALDFDKAGREGTERLIKMLERYGYRGEVNDLSLLFTLHRPEIEEQGLDDFGKWWEVIGRHQ